MRAATTASCVVAVGACSEEPLPAICPAVDPGELVVTEIRMEQGGTYGQWLEFANVGDATVDLEGLHIVLYDLDGSNEMDGIIRYKRELVAGDRFVVGKWVTTDEMPEVIDYGFNLDWPSDIKPDGIVEVRACGEVIDEVIYRGLPADGTYSLVEPPDADVNDDETAWCNDTEPPPEDEPMTEIGIRGTPGEVNNPCA